MNARWVAWVAALLGGCTQVANFAGAKIELTFDGTNATSTGRHLELWARDGEHTIVRLVASEIASDGSAQPAAYVLAMAVPDGDPCMIDGAGNLLTSEAAQPGPSDDDRARQAQAVRDRVAQLRTLVALVSYDDQSPSRPTLAADASAADRKAACDAYFARSPAAYSGNPAQLTAPLHGTFYGAVDYASLVPAQVLGGMEIVTDDALRDLRELWWTETPASVAQLDPNQLDCAAQAASCRGDLLLQGNAVSDGTGLFHIALASPRAGVTGTATVQTQLDQDSVQF